MARSVTGFTAARAMSRSSNARPMQRPLRRLKWCAFRMALAGGQGFRSGCTRRGGSRSPHRCALSPCQPSPMAKAERPSWLRQLGHVSGLGGALPPGDHGAHQVLVMGQAGKDHAQCRDRATRIEGSLVHLARLSEKLLQLARAESGIGLAAASTDLIPVLRLVVDDIARSTRSHGRIVLEIAPGTRVERSVDVDAFAIVVRNLVENPHPRRRRRAGADRGRTRRRLQCAQWRPCHPSGAPRGNDGRFRRGDTAALGAGLGLAIADSFARHMGGRLELRSPASSEGAGFEARLILS